MTRRRRRVVAATSLTGATLLGAGLSAEPGSRSFYAFTFGVAGTWAAGGVASGPLHLGRIRKRDLGTGVAAFGVFYAGAHLSRLVPPLERAVSRVFDFADEGDDRLVLLTTLTNGLAEEVFFRGALYSALPPGHAVAGSTAVYALATSTTRNPALVLAAGLMGTLFALQRRNSGGVVAPALTHLTWSTLMLRYLPPLFRRNPSPAEREARALRVGRGD